MRSVKLRWRRLAVGVAALLVCGGLVGWFLCGRPDPNEPVYNGRKVSHWIRHSLRVVPLANPGRAVRYVFASSENYPYEEFDSNALPYLVKALEPRADGTGNGWLRIWLKLPGWFQRRFPAPIPVAAIQEQVIETLERMGKKAGPAIPNVIAFSKREETREFAVTVVDCLAGIDKSDPRVHEFLVEAAKDTNASVRIEAVKQLEGLPAIELAP